MINFSLLKPPIISLKSMTILMVLIALSFIAGSCNIPISYGISFGFGSVFLFVILRYYGLLFGAAAGTLVSVLAWLVTGSNISIFLPLLEVIFVGIALCSKYRNMFVWDMVYWGVLGAPITALLFYLNQHGLGTEGYLTIADKSVNGLINILLADILVSYIPYRRLMGNKYKITFDFNVMLFHLSIFAVIIPFLLYTIVDGYYLRGKLNNEVVQIIGARSFNIMEQLKSWDEKDLRKIRLNSPLQIKRLKDIVNKNSDEGMLEIFVTDSKHNIYVTNQDMKKYSGVYDWKKEGQITTLAENIYLWIPVTKKFVSEISRWGRTFYIKTCKFDGIDMELQVKMPLTIYINDIWKSYLNKFISIYFLCIIATFISMMLSRILTRTLLNLAESTNGLPDKLKRQGEIVWPNSSISQIYSLVSNFRIMSDNLVKLFSETKIMNQKLLQKTYQLEKSKERLKRLAYFDPLTNLPNRLYFINYLSGLLKADKNRARTIALMFIDLNRFKQINDSLGHEVGDIMVKEIAKRLMVFLRKGSFIARSGGDEFAIVLHDTDREIAAETANYINNKLAEAFHLQNHGQLFELFVSASIGICMYPADTVEMSTLLKYADVAMYAAKETGENTYRFYSELSKTDISEKMYLEQWLHKSLERQELLLYYQPKIHIKTNEIKGMEALVRWNHPEKGLIPPMKFIPLAEETGFINQLGEWVLIEACKQNKAWQDLGYPKIRVSVNLSVKQFHGQDIVKTVSNALETTGLQPKYLELEITEGFLIKNMNYAVQVLNELNRMGVYISIDDFGTGYSSLGWLKQLPIHFLKIDKTFIDHIFTDKNNKSIVKAAVQLAHSMDLGVVAEGVETEQDREVLELLNCDEIQGYLISKPLAREDFEKWMTVYSLKKIFL